MEIKPLGDTRRQRRKPVALVLAAGPASLLLVTEDGEVGEHRGMARCAAALRALEGWQVYTTTAPRAVLLATGAEQWEGRTWQGALVSLKLDAGPVITPMRKLLAGLDPETALRALSDALSWLAGAGVVPASLSSMAWQLWRSSLSRPVRIYGPNRRAALYGGRQEAPHPGEYREASYWDLGAAYPSAMAAEPFPGRLVQVAPTTSMAEGVGLARAAVKLPQLPWGPLPVRVGPDVVCYGHGAAEGWWTWRELHLAREAGATVTVAESWAGMGAVDLFGPWWRMAAGGRQLPGHAAAIAKAVTSSLWGQFALSGDGGRRVRWRDRWGREALIVPDKPRKMPHRHTVYVACDIAARVRTRLYREGLSLPDAIYCDTDAVIAGQNGPQPAGIGPGLWRAKYDKVTNLDIRAPQVMRYGCEDCGNDHPQWHYVVAGASSQDAAERVFRREYRRQTTVRIGPGGTTLPNMNLDRARIPFTERERKSNAT